MTRARAEVKLLAREGKSLVLLVAGYSQAVGVFRVEIVAHFCPAVPLWIATTRVNVMLTRTLGLEGPSVSKRTTIGQRRPVEINCIKLIGPVIKIEADLADELFRLNICVHIYVCVYLLKKKLPPMISSLG